MDLAGDVDTAFQLARKGVTEGSELPVVMVKGTKRTVIGLACLAVPVVWHRKNTIGTVLAKVILIAVPYEQATLLEPQLQKLKLTVIPEIYQLI